MPKEKPKKKDNGKKTPNNVIIYFKNYKFTILFLLNFFKRTFFSIQYLFKLNKTNFSNAKFHVK